MINALLEWITPEVAQEITLLGLLTGWTIILAWQICLIILRSRPGVSKVKLISMVMKDLGYRAPSVVYGWFGLGAHWWWNSSEWATVPGSIAFWAILIGLGVWDAFVWRRDPKELPPLVRAVRHPVSAMLLGLYAGHVLFPQVHPR